MKKVIFLLPLFLIITPVVLSQTPKACEAYWVVETNVNNAAYSIIRLYDANHKVFFEKRMEGIYLDIRNKVHRKKLDRMVDHYYRYQHRDFPGKVLKFCKRPALLQKQ